MNSSIIQGNGKFQNGLNIHLVSFSLPKQVIKEKETIRVSITTMPDEIKQHFTIKGKLMDYTNHLFSLNITSQTKKIIMVFRKKASFLTGNPIIASTTIQLDNFKETPMEQITSGMINTEIRSVNIYYPLQKQMKEEHKKNVERLIVGNMKIQLSFTTPFKQVKQDIIKGNGKNNKNNNKQCPKEHKARRRSGKKISEYKELDDDSICDELF